MLEDYYLDELLAMFDEYASVNSFDEDKAEAREVYADEID